MPICNSIPTLPFNYTLFDLLFAFLQCRSCDSRALGLGGGRTDGEEAGISFHLLHALSQKPRSIPLRSQPYFRFNRLFPFRRLAPCCCLVFLLDPPYSLQVFSEKYQQIVRKLEDELKQEQELDKLKRNHETKVDGEPSATVLPSRL